MYYSEPYAPIVNTMTFCERDEIADPNKLLLIIKNNNVTPQSSTKNWSVYMHNNEYFYTNTIPWTKTYNSYGIEIKSHHFRVLCTDPAVFTIDIDNIFSWFTRNYSKLFLISHIITSHEPTNKKYVSKNSSLIAVDQDNEMDKILINKCYTICNGVTLLLALHRLNIVDVDTTYTILTHLSSHEYTYNMLNEGTDAGAADVASSDTQYEDEDEDEDENEHEEEEENEQEDEDEQEQEQEDEDENVYEDEEQDNSDMNLEEFDYY